MGKKLIFLGIETSCDETAAAIVEDNSDGTGEILSNIVSSQVEEHREFGGIVPEVAARAHVEKIEFIVQKAIEESSLDLENLDGIAATAGPGLIVCLTVGLNTGKAIAGSLKKPFIAVNHLEGHALSPKINNKIKFPYLFLLISGGHTQFLEVNGVNNYKRLGTTIDDALGEAFDKTAKILGIEFPGGPKIEEYAKLGDKNYYSLPKPIINRGGCNLSFAGLKTAVLKISKEPVSLETPVGDEEDSSLGDFIEDQNALQPLDASIRSNLGESTTKILATLTPREERVLRMRFGIGMNTDHTLEEVGLQFSVTRERIRQIEAKALRKLKHPSRSKHLKSFLEK